MTTNPPTATKKRGILEFIGKRKATFEAVTVLSEKQGQKDVKPATDLKITVRTPNSKLVELDDALYAFCFHNSGRGNTDTLEGIEVVSGEPNLTNAFLKMGASFDWEYEQTGCSLLIYVGPGAKPKITLRSCTVRKLTITGHEGGSTDWTFHVYTADLDEDVFGQLAVLKSQERDIELTAPDLLTGQRELSDEEQPLGGESPEAALAKADAKARGTAKPH